MERWGHTPRDGGVSDALEKSYSPAVLLIDRKSTRSSDEVKSAKKTPTTKPSAVRRIVSCSRR